jgi:hypothetical protein
MACIPCPEKGQDIPFLEFTEVRSPNENREEIDENAVLLRFGDVALVKKDE